MISKWTARRVYSTYDMLLAPIPRALPKEVTNTIYITTKHGELSIPFVVSIPDLTINGLKNEFTQPGDTTVITGDNFDLYGITIEEAIVNLGNLPVNVIDATRTELTIEIPANATPKSTLTIKGPIWMKHTSSHTWIREYLNFSISIIGREAVLLHIPANSLMPRKISYVTAH